MTFGFCYSLCSVMWDWFGASFPAKRLYMCFVKFLGFLSVRVQFHIIAMLTKWAWAVRPSRKIVSDCTQRSLIDSLCFLRLKNWFPLLAVVFWLSILYRSFFLPARWMSWASTSPELMNQIWIQCFPVYRLWLSRVSHRLRLPRFSPLLSLLMQR